MDQHPDPRQLDSGFASLQFVLAAALAMLVVVGVVQLVAYQYARGAVQAALERSTRAASVVGSGAGQCEAALGDSLAATLGGELEVSFGCEVAGDQVVAWAAGTVPGWVFSVADMAFEIEARAQREPDP